MSRVTLRYEPEDEHHGELFMSGEAAGFSGRSSAWFSKTDVERFSVALQGYPIASINYPKLAGGAYTVEGALKEVWAAIEVMPWNSTGTLVARVELRASQAMGDWRRHCAAFDFLTNYAALDTFRREIEGVLHGAREEATLTGTNR